MTINIVSSHEDFDHFFTIFVYKILGNAIRFEPRIDSKTAAQLKALPLKHISLDLKDILTIFTWLGRA